MNALTLVFFASLAIIAESDAQIIQIPNTAPAKPICGANEVYLPQGVAPNCDTVCSELGNECTIVFIQPPYGCYCLPNYARNAKNVCIPISKCPKKCGIIPVK